MSSGTVACPSLTLDSELLDVRLQVRIMYRGLKGANASGVSAFSGLERGRVQSKEYVEDHFQ